MGTQPLTDITANANNIGNTRLARSKVPQALSGTPQNEKFASIKATPRFMSPTMSSSRQATPILPSTDMNRASTPNSIVSNKSKASNWVSSAARRVGVGRVSDGGIPSGLVTSSARKHVGSMLPEKVIQQGA